MDARVAEIVKEMTDYGVNFDMVQGMYLSAEMREELLYTRGEFMAKSLESKLRDLDGYIEATDAKGRIHETIDANGSVTGRMKHSKPNLAGVSKDYDIRKLFKAPDGYRMVGVDAKALELRLLAHYMGDLDYIEEIKNGDIHRAYQMATGLQSRDKAKSFIFALIYGAGDEKIGSILGRTAREANGIKRNFNDNTPAFEDLRRTVIRKATNDKLKGLDGRGIEVDKPYKALNYLLQRAGAVVMKRALVILYDRAKAEGIDFHLVLNVHDEIQAEVKEGSEWRFGELAVEAIVKAGEYYDLLCPMDAEYKIGPHWALTH